MNEKEPTKFVQIEQKNKTNRIKQKFHSQWFDKLSSTTSISRYLGFSLGDTLTINKGADDKE